MPRSTATHGLCLCRRYLATMSSSCNLRSVACYYLCPVTARPLTSNRKQAYSCTEEVFDVLKVSARPCSERFHRPQRSCLTTRHSIVFAGGVRHLPVRPHGIALRASRPRVRGVARPRVSRPLQVVPRDPVRPESVGWRGFGGNGANMNMILLKRMQRVSFPNDMCVHCYHSVFEYTEEIIFVILYYA